MKKFFSLVTLFSLLSCFSACQLTDEVNPLLQSEIKTDNSIIIDGTRVYEGFGHYSCYRSSAVCFIIAPKPQRGISDVLEVINSYANKTTYKVLDTKILTNEK